MVKNESQASLVENRGA